MFSRKPSFTENQRLAYRELWLLVTRRPAQSAQWHDFWILWLAVMIPWLVIVVGLLDPPFFSLTMLVALAILVVAARVLRTVLGRLGIVQP